ncbi:TPA: hypothetical protein ACPVXQ_004662 [Vibrio parahaemolyticus]|uniref:hypothetical protein n=1 Tax=Vibrio parahaemolyticus TaxID=670 RepID=UPI00038E3576|nr:hypothetical protein [Vibrio parahaemolyticus]EGR1121080.1 hypothetical protein [Vibrio parahaemolyticus]EQM12288.1 putative membrane protein [Vibrio parahaemolyticus 3259]ETJ85741.1 putative membrane protein [Vibrio parahaemolyticus EKP-008]TOB14939.1 hypothetical protein CGK10_24195 [Vibrio parahaemolyticus]HBN6204315.1 hypothetical protein [Vibrio parahaemolyticus]
MTTSEIFIPFLINALFAITGSFASVGAVALKELTILDADNPAKCIQNPISESGRKKFVMLFSLAPFVVGGIWGLIYVGAFTDMNEALSYAVAMVLGIVANSVVLKANGLSIQEVIELIKRNFPNNGS